MLTHFELHRVVYFACMLAVAWPCTPCHTLAGRYKTVQVAAFVLAIALPLVTAAAGVLLAPAVLSQDVCSSAVNVAVSYMQLGGPQRSGVCALLGGDGDSASNCSLAFGGGSAPVSTVSSLDISGASLAVLGGGSYCTDHGKP